MRIAALDLGSNTSLLLIADMNGPVIERVVLDETTITRLGQGVNQSHSLHPEALERMEACFKDYSAKIKHYDCARTVAVSTSAARDVSNGHLLIELGQKYDIPIHIISGAREAALTFAGAVAARSDVAVIDVGGGSTEIITQAGGVSVDVGSVRLFEMFIHADPLPLAQRVQIAHYARTAFAKVPPPPQDQFSEVVAVAGTPTTLAALDQGRPFSEELINGYKMSLTQLEAWIDRLTIMTLAERSALPGMQPKRADVIVAGAIILAESLKYLNKNQFTVSTRGVRYGVASAWQSF